jgi:hypothetical protein
VAVANFGVIRRELMAAGFTKAFTDNLELILTKANSADTTATGNTTDITTLQTEVAAIQLALDGDEAEAQGIRDTADLALALATSGGVSGSATPPGGTPGQVQFNSAGTFGGFTVSGDGTLNTSTGVLTNAQAARLTTARNIAITGDLAWNVTFDGSAAVTAAGTLATVNATTGSFGSGTSVASFTVNAKGLITAASSVAIVSAPKWTTARTLSYTGDVTGTGSVDGSGDVATALTIAANAVTTTKIINSAVTLAKIANAAGNSKLLGSGATGSGSAYSELTLGSNLSMSGTTLNVSGTIASAGGSLASSDYRDGRRDLYANDRDKLRHHLPARRRGRFVGHFLSGRQQGLSRPGRGAGAFVRVKLTSAFSGAAYSVGAKGTGGSSGDNAGTNGGDTTFTATGGGTVYTAGGGTGGNNGGSALSTFPTYSNSVAGGTATNGDVKINGQYSLFGLALSSVLTLGGGGGNSQFGAGGVGTGLFLVNTTAAGGAGQGFGTGGGAPSATGTGAAQAGANGADGYIEIWEYS